MRIERSPVATQATWPLEARIASEQRELEAWTRTPDAAQRRPAFQVLAETAGLSPLEQQVLLLAAASSLDGAFAPAYAELHGDSHRDHASLHLALSLFAAPDDRLVAADCLLPGRALRQLRLVEVASGAGAPGVLRALTVDERLSDYLRGVNRLDERLEPYLAALPQAVATGPSTSMSTAIVAIVQADLGRWPTLNLVGPADGGGREGVAQACLELGLRLRRLDLDRLAILDPGQRAEVVTLLGREAVLADLAVIVDASGAEKGSPAAAAVDDLIRTLRAPLFVISPERWPAGDALVDILPICRPTRSEQRSLWRSALAPYQHSVNGEVEAIVQQFDFGPATIGEVVARARLRRGDHRQRAVGVLPGPDRART